MSGLSDGDMRPVLAACDGRSPATLRLAVLLARTLHTELVVTTAYRYEPVGVGPAPVPSADNDLRLAGAERTLDRVLATVPGDVRSSGRVIPATGTVDALLDLADEVDASVLVVGPDERGRVAEDLPSRARCPVVVAPADALLVPERLARIGAAFDGSDTGHLAFTATARLALAADASLTAIGVAADDDERRELEREASGTIARNRQDVHLEIRTGPPATELRHACEDLDLLVCGSRGRGRLTRALLGSVSTELIAEPPCAIMVVGRHLQRHVQAPLGVAG